MPETVADVNPRSTQSDKGVGGTRISVVPCVVLGALLLLATWFNGAFALRHWAPVAILGLVLSASAVLAGGARSEDRAARVAGMAIFGLAGWCLVSAVWAAAAGPALEGGARTLLYAALFLVALITPATGSSGRKLGWALVGVGGIAVITVLQLFGDPTTHFLAGRLDDPVGYRNATACLFAFAFWPLIGIAAHQACNPFLRAPATLEHWVSSASPS